MAAINDPYLRQAVYTSLDTKYLEIFQSTPSFADKIATRVNSTSRATRHAWLSQIGPLVEYVGEKPVEQVSARAYVITNKKYGKVLEIPEEDIDDDQIGIYGNLAGMLGAQAKKWPDDMIVSLLQTGKTQLAWDGQPFWNASHPVNIDKSSAGTFSNLRTAFPLTATNFETLWQQMGQFKLENGRFLPIMPVATLVDPTNTIALRRILNSQLIGYSVPAGTGVGGAAAVTNVLQGATQEITIPELGNEPGVWYMIGSLFGVNPFLYQVRKDPVTTPLTDAQSQNVFWHDKLEWGVKARGNAGFTFPFLAIRCEPT